MLTSMVLFVCFCSLTACSEHIYRRHDVRKTMSSMTSSFDFDCARSCLKNDSCTSFFIHDESLECTLMHTVLNADEVRSYEMDGWSYYISEGTRDSVSMNVIYPAPTDEVTEDIYSTLASVATSIGSIPVTDIFTNVTAEDVSCNSSSDTEWHPVFGISNGGEFGVYDLYTSNVTLGECNTSVTDLGVNTLHHYKSGLLRIWEKLEVTQVKLSIFEDNKEVQFFLFNGTGSNASNWMDADKLINSSYSVTDLQDPINNFFSIYGHYIDTLTNRRFYINRSYGGCGNDYGWIFVLAGYANVCNEDKRQSVTIYYSPNSTFSAYSDYRIADSLVVFIKGDSIPHQCCQGSCPSLYSMTNESTCLKFHISTITYTDMQSVCQAEGGELVKIETDVQKENFDFYIDSIVGVTDVDLRIMIQGREETPFGIWKFDDGSEMTYLPWNPGQPNNPDHTCISMRVDSFLWNDVKCTTDVIYEKAFVCETKPY